jgi:hypothetical protein
MTGKRSVCTVPGTMHLFEGVRDRPNSSPFSPQDGLDGANLNQFLEGFLEDASVEIGIGRRNRVF